MTHRPESTSRLLNVPTYSVPRGIVLEYAIISVLVDRSRITLFTTVPTSLTSLTRWGKNRRRTDSRQIEKKGS